MLDSSSIMRSPKEDLGFDDMVLRSIQSGVDSGWFLLRFKKILEAVA